MATYTVPFPQIGGIDLNGDPDSTRSAIDQMIADLTTPQADSTVSSTQLPQIRSLRDWIERDMARTQQVIDGLQGQLTTISDDPELTAGLRNAQQALERSANTYLKLLSIESKSDPNSTPPVLIQARDENGSPLPYLRDSRNPRGSLIRLPQELQAQTVNGETFLINPASPTSNPIRLGRTPDNVATIENAAAQRTHQTSERLGAEAENARERAHQAAQQAARERAQQATLAMQQAQLDWDVDKAAIDLAMHEGRMTSAAADREVKVREGALDRANVRLTTAVKALSDSDLMNYNAWVHENNWHQNVFTTATTAITAANDRLQRDAQGAANLDDSTRRSDMLARTALFNAAKEAYLDSLKGQMEVDVNWIAAYQKLLKATQLGHTLPKDALQALTTLQGPRPVQPDYNVLKKLWMDTADLMPARATYTAPTYQDLPSKPTMAPRPVQALTPEGITSVMGIALPGVGGGTGGGGEQTPPAPLPELPSPYEGMEPDIGMPTTGMPTTGMPFPYTGLDLYPGVDMPGFGGGEEQPFTMGGEDEQGKIMPTYETPDYLDPAAEQAGLMYEPLQAYIPQDFWPNAMAGVVGVLSGDTAEDAFHAVAQGTSYDEWLLGDDYENEIQQLADSFGTDFGEDFGSDFGYLDWGDS